MHTSVLSARPWRRPVASVAVAALTAATLLVSLPADPASASSPCQAGTLDLVGDGDAESPCLISTLADLESLRDAVNAGDGQAGVHFLQTADIDLSSVPSWVAIGMDDESDARFFGNYDGGLRRITGMRIRNATPEDGYPAGAEYFGLFGFVRNGSIERLRLTGVDIDVSITGATDSLYVGGLAAYVQSSSSPATTIVSAVSVEGDITLDYAGERGAYVGGVVGRAGRGAKLEDRISFVGTVSGTYASSSLRSGSSQVNNADANFGGLVGRMSSSSTLSLGYAQADVNVTVAKLPDDSLNHGAVYVGVLTGSSSGNTSRLEELYAVGSVSVTGGTASSASGVTIASGVVGFIEDEDDTFVEIYYLDTIGDFSGAQVTGFDPQVGLIDVVALEEAQMRGAAAALHMTGTEGRWAYRDTAASSQLSVQAAEEERWVLVLEPAGYPVFAWQVDAAAADEPVVVEEEPVTEESVVVEEEPVTEESVVVEEEPVVEAPVVVEETVVEAPVTEAPGTTLDGPVPTEVPAGEGRSTPALPSGLVSLTLLAVAGAALAVRRQVAGGVQAG